jgi:hypothetical protein
MKTKNNSMLHLIRIYKKKLVIKFRFKPTKIEEKH